MITEGILFKNFNKKKNTNFLKKKLKTIFKENNNIIKSLRDNYKSSYKKEKIKSLKNFSNIRVIGMGGSTLGTHSIYDFLKAKIRKKFEFIENLKKNISNKNSKKYLNLIVSKSGETLETIINSNIYIKKKDKNIFITDNKKSYLNILANKLKSEIVHHNNFIGGRYSVLSEVGMLPAELMGLSSNKFRQLNNLIKNQKYLNSLVSNVGSILHHINTKKYNSIIINYDDQSKSLFSWYQQLLAESLGKKQKGILPIISNMPKDNHSMMQLYLDGFKNNFYTFFYVHEKNLSKSLKKGILTEKKYLINKSLDDIIFFQKKATENIFKKKNIPFRSFEIYERNEKTLGELFTFFILEVILLGKALKINPYNQPAVELIKKETKKILIKSSK